MSEIRLEAKHAFNTNFAHLYLVFRDDRGEEFVTSLTNERNTEQNWPIRWSIDQINKRFADSSEARDQRDVARITLDLGGRDAADVWDVITQAAEQFQVLDLPYQIVTSNSNALASALLYAVGIDIKNVLPNFLPGVNNDNVSAEVTIPVGDPFLGARFTADLEANGQKFTGIFGAQSARLEIDGPVFNDFIVPSAVVPDDGILYYTDFRDRGGIFSNDKTPGPPQILAVDFTLRGLERADLIRGARGNDKLFGGSGDDTLIGGDGADTFNGGPGNDWLAGGGGPDRFEFFADQSNDTIFDFNKGTDRIAIANFVFVPPVMGGQVIRTGLGGSSAVDVFGSPGIERTADLGALGVDVIRTPVISSPSRLLLFEDLDTNVSGTLDDADRDVTVNAAGDTVLDLTPFAPGRTSSTLTLLALSSPLGLADFV